MDKLGRMATAIDEINLKFRQLTDIFKQAGASVEEFAQLADLYTRQRTDAIK